MIHQRSLTFDAVIFDLDGTLVDSGLDFGAIRREMGLGPEPILEAMEKLPPERRRACDEILLRHEMEGAHRAALHDGAMEWIRQLDALGRPRAVFTRNARSIVNLTLERCGLFFETIVAREDAPPKPDPTAIHDLCRRWRIAESRVLVIGDYLYDIDAGRAAGAITALVTHGKQWHFADQADHVWKDLTEGLESCGLGNRRQATGDR